MVPRQSGKCCDDFCCPAPVCQATVENDSRRIQTYLKEYCEYVSLERASKDDGRFPVAAARLVLRQGNHVGLFYKAGVWELEPIRDFKPVAQTLFYNFETAADKFIEWSLAAIDGLAKERETNIVSNTTDAIAAPFPDLEYAE